MKKSTYRLLLISMVVLLIYTLPGVDTFFSTTLKFEYHLNGGDQPNEDPKGNESINSGGGKPAGQPPEDEEMSLPTNPKSGTGDKPEEAPIGNEDNSGPGDNPEKPPEGNE